MSKWFRIGLLLCISLFTLYLANEYTKYNAVKEVLIEKKDEKRLLDVREKKANQLLKDLEQEKERVLSSQFFIDSNHPIYQKLTEISADHGLSFHSTKFLEEPFTITTEIAVSGNKDSWHSFIEHLKIEQKALFLKSVKMENGGEVIRGTVELIWYVDNKRGVPVDSDTGQK
jgi:hypothetical protein